jgi:putative ABC transport system permease protein
MRQVRYALRTLSRTPGFALSVILTLGLGIGANTAVFSAIDAVLLRSLPFPDGDQLVQVGQRRDRSSETLLAPVRLEDWHASNATFEVITGYYTEDISETSGELPERVRRAMVAPRFFDLWQVAPARGRTFTPDEYRFGGPRAVIVSNRYWRVRFAADPNILDRTLRIGNARYAIVAVMPASFLFLDRNVDVWFPVPTDAPYAQSREGGWYTAIGRLKNGVTLEQARADLRAVQGTLGDRYGGPDREIRPEIVPLKDAMVARARSSLWLLFAAVTVLLLITCTNVAALFLSRGVNRRREIGIRISLGSSRGAIVAQTLIETLLLALAGGALGLLASAAAARGFRVMAAGLPRADEIALDTWILLYTLGCAIGVTLLSGLIPAVRSTRIGAAEILASAGGARSTARLTAHWVLVGVQVTLASVLLSGAGVLLRSLQELGRVNPGFDPSRVLTFHISATFNEWGDMPRLTRRIDATLDALGALPDVEAAATT